MKLAPGAAAAATAADESTTGPEFDTALMDDVRDRLGVSGVAPASDEAAAPAEKPAGAAAAAVVEDEDEDEKDEADGAAEGDADAGKDEDEDEADGAAEGDEGAGKDEGDGKSAAEGDEGAGDPEIAKLKLPAETQAAINRRIGKLTREKKEAQEALEAEQAERERLAGEVSTLTAAVAEAQGAGAEAAGVNPLFLAQSETEIDRREAQIMQFRRFARAHPEGYEGTDETKDPSWSREEIAAKLAEMDDELLVTLPRARQVLQRRQALRPVVRKHYPALLDPKSPDAVIMTALLAAVPGLKRLPNVEILIGDMIAGERARKALAAKPPAAATPPARAPKVPTVSAATTPKPTRTLPTREAGKDYDVKKFVEAGGDRAALVAQIESLLPA